MEELPEIKQEDGEPLKWVTIKPDNLLVRSLKEMAGNLAYMVEKEIKQTEKTLKKAEKVFYGR